SQRGIAAGFYPEIMTVGVSEKDGIISCDAADEILGRIKNCDAVVFGPGLGRGREIRLLLKKMLREYENTLVIDADGLNALSENKDMLRKRKCNVILTPHPGEMSRLCGLSVNEVQSDRVNTAMKFAKEYEVCLVLKGMGTFLFNYVK
ncbi:MAG: NAD(P)H-hydrate dehydratase, partial [Firmicutes bacterium]|nr:NAD(P)H-hydrate dehydratase [Bacillota bacterium]